jgi:hypothetical protein
MKAIIEFDLDDEYDQHLFEVMNNAKNLLTAIQTYDGRLRAMHKYEDKAEAYDYREILRGIMDENNVIHLL